MNTRTEWTPGRLRIHFEAEAGDPMARGKATFVGSVASVALPEAVQAEDVHPDLEALAILLLVERFIGPRIIVSRPVSRAFADAVRTGLRREIGPVDPDLAPRIQPPDGRPGLAFSGGADSFAALAVLPDSVVPVFLRRSNPPGEPVRTMYRDEAAVHACAELEARGLPVKIVDSDIEHLRKPVGFLTDWANAIGAVIMADVLGLDSISWGLVAESGYRIGHEEYFDWADRRRRSGWPAAFEATGLDFVAPVVGVSEVGTTAIARASVHGTLSQSCIRGGIGEPCRNCWKCFRKSMLDAATTGVWPEHAEITRLFAVKEVQRRLGDLPIPHEDVVAWFAGRYKGSHPQMLLLRERTQAASLGLDWLERWYTPSAEQFPARHRAAITAKLDSFLERMSPEQESEFRAWNMHARLADSRTTRSRAALLGEHVPMSFGLGRIQASLARFAR